MIHEVYEELPLVLFFKIAKDEKRYLHLLKDKKSKSSNKKLSKIWESHKDRWDADHPSSDWVQQKTLYKKCLVTSTKLKKDRFFIEFLTSCEIVPSEEVFIAAGWNYTTDLNKICSIIEKSIAKESNQLEIWNAQYKSLAKRLEEQQKTPIEQEESNIYEVIGSLQIATSLRLDPSTITIGDYNGLTKSLEKKNKLLEKQSNAR